MSTTYTWIVNALDTAPSENGLSDVVKVVHWRFGASNGIHYADTFSALSLEDANSENFIVFNDLTEAQVISWIESKLDVEQLKVKLDAELERLANPPIVSRRCPWLT